MLIVVVFAASFLSLAINQVVKKLFNPPKDTFFYKKQPTDD